ncbi:lipopolysaccharide biosynthesis protein [Dyadobacter sp. LHD-138]|uniref:lipopolysaccharide biosynthesis protein n=1 Tax=Dyadobacter sp. LHD-138 TaxID=3071413 RepID=UPI0027DF980C|nr:lipopolysaccharide biosynthesis protein [Dyadobacter sp. LHD-138]MDQ6481881.1 lipopolysaccharide biosynthesis protein [Dyadobacter sp. LHD-138]
MFQPPIISDKKIPEVHEISFSEIFNFIKRYSVRSLLVGFIFGLIGYGISYLLPVSFKASTLLLPESGIPSNSLGSLSGLARLSGLTKNESGGALQPELYPVVLQTVPFSLYLLKQSVTDENNRVYKSFEDFLHRDDSKNDTKKKNKKIFPKINSQILSIARDKELDSKRVLSLVTTLYDMKTGIISIEAETSDPLVTAQVVEASRQYLIQYVTNYRTEKTIREVQFLGQRAIEAKKREQNAEFALQSYRDRNRSSFLNVARIEEQRLQSDYTLAQSLYSDIVRRWEEAKIKVKEQQPVIKVLEPSKVPTIKSKPRRLIIALIFSVTGVLFSLTYLLFFKEKSYLLSPSK